MITVIAWPADENAFEGFANYEYMNQQLYAEIMGWAS